MNINQSLFDFIKNSPSAYHTVDTVKGALAEAGYSELYEGAEWKLSAGGKYFTVRNGTSLIAFRMKKDVKGFMIAASHSDFPAFRLKMTPEAVGISAKLLVERYGGMINYTWLDRPLSIAGRVLVRTECGIESRLCNIDRDLCVIPSVAIHLNRSVNDGYKFNPAVDLLPLSGDNEGIMDEIAAAVGAKRDDIISHDLFVYNRDLGREFGIKNEFILAPRLDDLGCVFSSLRAFLESADTDSVPVFAVFDNEEVGSATKQGAASTLLCDTLSRIAGKDYSSALANSLMLSADNGHALHPNHPEYCDPTNRPVLGGGVLLKYNTSKRYITDGESGAYVRLLCKKNGIPFQTFANRSDMPGGSTLGNVSGSQFASQGADIGLAQLAMHSSYETAACADSDAMVKLTQVFFED